MTVAVEVPVVADGSATISPDPVALRVVDVLGDDVLVGAPAGRSPSQSNGATPAVASMQLRISFHNRPSGSYR